MVQITFGGLTFGKSPIIKSVQYGTCFLDSSTSETETITSVVTANSLLLYLGMSASSHTPVTEWDDLMVKLTLTNSTTVTVDRTANPSSMYVSFCVVEFYPGVVKSNQSGTITIPVDDISADDTITSVDTSKSIVSFLGNITTVATSTLSDGDSAMSRVLLIDSTTVRAGRRDWPAINTVVLGYQVVEFY